MSDAADAMDGNTSNAITSVNHALTEARAAGLTREVIALEAAHALLMKVWHREGQDSPAVPSNFPLVATPEGDKGPALIEQDVIDAQDKVRRFRNGNTVLLEALMGFVANKDGHYGFALSVLAEAGMLTPEGTPDWTALEARKPKQQTWAEAVNECVSDPAERARLLALDDAGPGEVT